MVEEWCLLENLLEDNLEIGTKKETAYGLLSYIFLQISTLLKEQFV